jgi:hypothetical protein
MATCAGGGVIPDWLPEWLHPWLAGSQGIDVCGIEWPMLLVGILVLVAVLAVVDRDR